MATAIQRRRGSSTQHSNFTGLAGEITIDTTLNTVIVHDGSTAGGIRLAKYSEVQAAAAGDITAVNTLSGSGLIGGSNSGAANIALDYENLQGNLIPSADDVYSLGSPDKVWKDVYVGPGSLYINGQKVLEDNSGTISVGADDGQNLALNTTGGGDIEFNAVGGGTISMKSNVVLSTGISLSSAGGDAMAVSSNINMSDNQINNVGTPAAGTDAVNKSYVDNDSSVVRVTGNQSVAGVKTFSDNLVIQGNLTISGTTTTVNSETISLADNIIDLNSNFTTGTPSENSGLRIKRGDSADVQLRWNEASDVWEFSNDGSTYVKIAVSTTDLAEGTNLYFTDARARTAVSAGGDLGYNSTTGVISFTERTDAEVRGLVSASGDLSYNSTTGAFSFTERTDSEVRGLVSASGDLSYNSTTGAFSFTERTDSEVRTLVSAAGDLGYDGDTGVFTFTERTDAEVKALIDASGDLSYNSTTGVISFTERTDSEVRGLVSSSGDLSYNSTTGVISFTERTDAEVRGLVSASGDLSYNSTTGAFSFTERTDSEVRGLVSAGGDLGYNSTTGVISFTERTDAEVRGLVSGGTGISYNSTTGSVSVDSTIATKTYADNAASTAVSAVIDAAPGTLDTLNELAAALGDDANFATTITDSLATKYDSADFNGDFDTRLASKSTSNVSEGSNLYHTTARARASISASGSLSYNSTTGVVSYTTPTTIASISNHDTGDLTEGSNQYYTVSRANSAIDARVTNSFIDALNVDADTLDGQHGSYYRNASNLNAGTLSSARLPDLVVGDFAGAAIQTSAESFGDSDTVLMTAKAIADKIESYGYITTQSDDQTLSWNGSNGILSIGGGNSVDLDGRYSQTDTNTTYSAGTDLTLSGTTFNVTSATSATANRIAKRDSSGNLTANVFNGTATSARYADLAEKYATDEELEAGTVVCFGGDAEVTSCGHEAHHAVAGVISTDPAYMMNSEAEGQYVALTGRVPVKVFGPVAKGDLMVTSSEAGHAKSDNNAQAGRILGKAIGSHTGEGAGIVEVLITLM